MRLGGHFDPYEVMQIRMPVRCPVYVWSEAVQVLRMSHFFFSPRTAAGITLSSPAAHRSTPQSPKAGCMLSTQLLLCTEPHMKAEYGSEPHSRPSSSTEQCLSPTFRAVQSSGCHVTLPPEELIPQCKGDMTDFMAGAEIHLHAWLCRYCSEAFHLCPHRGRYPQGGRQRSTTPDMLSMQALLAGMADRGAQAAIIEASEEGLHCGRSVRNPLGSGGF